MNQWNRNRHSSEPQYYLFSSYLQNYINLNVTHSSFYKRLHYKFVAFYSWNHKKTFNPSFSFKPRFEGRFSIIKLRFG